MKKIKIGVIIAAIIVIIVNLTFIDYSNLNWLKNSGPYLGILAMICVILGGAISIRNEKKRQAKN
jgi:hypothetical protein